MSTFPATNSNEAVELIIDGGNQLHQIINEDATTEVQTESGPIPSVRKALADTFLFLDPIPWNQGSDETAFNQLRTFDNNVYWAPTATLVTPVPMGVTPVGDNNWHLAPVSLNTNNKGIYKQGVRFDNYEDYYTFREGQDFSEVYLKVGVPTPYLATDLAPNDDNNLTVNKSATQQWVSENSGSLTNKTKDGTGLDANSLFEEGEYNSIDGSIINTPNSRRGTLTVKELEGRYQQIFRSDNGGFYTRMTTNLIYDDWSTIYGEDIALSSISTIDPAIGTNVTLTDEQRSSVKKVEIKGVNELTGPVVESAGDTFLLSSEKLASLGVDYPASFQTNMEGKLNLHFGTMHGNPFKQGESGGTVSYIVTSNATQGAYSLVLADTTDLQPNQTVVYRCIDNTYKTNVIDSINSLTVNLKKPLQKEVGQGAHFWNFWDDRAHANEFGFYAIADDAIEELRYVGEVQKEILPSQLKPLTSSDTIQLLNDDDPNAPGCEDVQYARVSASVNGGAKAEPVKLTGGLYRVAGVINPSVNKDINEILVGVTQSRPRENNLTPVSQLVANQRISVKDCLVHFEFTFYAQDGHYQSLIFQSDTVGIFEIGKCEFVKVKDNINTLNSGKHVLFGDSWIARGHITNRLRERLPNATFVQKGNAGFASDQLFGVFDIQVTPEKPDNVWLMCSTNDYFRNYTVDKFSFEMGRIKQKIFNINANCIGWDSTVGANDDPDPQYSHNLNRSREYALVTSYRKSNVTYDYYPVKLVRDTFSIKETIPAGQEVLAGVMASTENDVNIVYSAFENVPTVDVKIGLTSSVAVPFSNIISWSAGVLKRPRDGEKVIYDGTRKIPTISLTNNDVSPVTIVGTIIVEYYPER